MSDAAYHRNLRIGITGFSEADAQDIAEMVRSVWTSQAPWVVSTEAPVDALLLARGTRPDDPEHSAVLRVNLGGKPSDPRDAERRLEPLTLRKPIRTAALRLALEAALARIRRYRR